MDALKALSDSVAVLAAGASTKLFHIPSPMGGRTGLSFDGKLILVPAFEASPGETLTILAPGGTEVVAKVAGFDPGLGLAALELTVPLPGSAWTPAQTGPALGSLVLVAAYPSPEGPEVRLDTLRLAAGSGDAAYLQTDGVPFPGFAGAALVDPQGSLAGFALSAHGGNRGWALPSARAAALVTAIASGQTTGRAWLGIATVPIEAPAGFAAAFGDSRESALLISGVEAESPAAKAGLAVGDILISLAGSAVTEPEELLATLDRAKAGEELTVLVLRSGEKKELKATPSSRPAAHEGRRHGRHGGWWMGGGQCGSRTGR
jgi:S1-C subfamily serine protease